MKLEQHGGFWVVTYKGEEYHTGSKDIMDAINKSVEHFNFATKEAV